MKIEIRPAEAGDAEAITELHAASWRSTYRGIFSDAFLDGDVRDDRRRHWNQQLHAMARQDLRADN